MSNRFQAFCEEDDCLWSSTSEDTRDSALGAFERHAEDIHGTTDTTTLKFAIDEEERSDDHGNRVRQEGVDRCPCGCKYWENDRCIDCGGTEPEEST